MLSTWEFDKNCFVLLCTALSVRMQRRSWNLLQLWHPQIALWIAILRRYSQVSIRVIQWSQYVWFTKIFTYHDDDNILDIQVASQVAKKQYDEKVGPTTMLPKELGNMYCASLYAGLATLVHNKASSLVSTLVLVALSCQQQFVVLYCGSTCVSFVLRRCKASNIWFFLLDPTGWPENTYVLVRKWLSVKSLRL